MTTTISRLIGFILFILIEAYFMFFSVLQAHAQVKVRGSFNSCMINGVTYRIEDIKLSTGNHQKKTIILLDNDSIKMRATFCGHGQYYSYPKKRIADCWVRFETYVDGKWYRRTDHPGRHGKQTNAFNRTCWSRRAPGNNQSEPMDLTCGYRHTIIGKNYSIEVLVDFQCTFDM